MTKSHERRLTDEEANTWFNVWLMCTVIPPRLDAMLKREAGISYCEYRAMQVVSLVPRGHLRLGVLAGETGMTVSHISRVVSRLADLGYMRKSPDPTDGRSTRVELTAMGMDTVQQVSPSVEAHLLGILFSRLTEEEHRTFGAAMGKFAAAIKNKGSIFASESPTHYVFGEDHKMIQ